MKNHLIIIAGASGTGKTTVSDYLRTTYGIPPVVTHTTRPRRSNEVDGRDYHFETPESFAKQHMLEQVTYAGYQYGSSKEGLQKALARHPVVSIVLDTVGAATYLTQLHLPMTVIFLTVKDEATLRARLLKRGDDPSRVAARLASPESRRDLVKPASLGQAIVVDNTDWARTKEAIDATMAKIEAELDANL